MGYITFDYSCPRCVRIEERLVRRDEMDTQVCEVCNERMVRLPAGSRTTFRFADEKLK